MKKLEIIKKMGKLLKYKIGFVISWQRNGIK